MNASTIVEKQVAISLLIKDTAIFRLIRKKIYMTSMHAI